MKKNLFQRGEGSRSKTSEPLPRWGILQKRNGVSREAQRKTAWGTTERPGERSRAGGWEEVRRKFRKQGVKTDQKAAGWQESTEYNQSRFGEFAGWREKKSKGKRRATIGTRKPVQKVHEIQEQRKQKEGKKRHGTFIPGLKGNTSGGWK